MSLVEAARSLAAAADALSFGEPVRYVYNPLVYARRPHEAYLARYGGGPKRVVFVGMNPGPWGMAQTGVPFGEIEAVRDWLGIHETVGHPPVEHPRRPVLGFAVTRREPSGQRLWGLMRRRFGTPRAFFAEHFVANYCPLLFLDGGGRNLTPDKLPAAERRALYAVCDEHLRRLVRNLEPEWLVGVGTFTRRRIEALSETLLLSGPGVSSPFRVTGILHPSPASPRANRDWAAEAVRELEAAGIW
jgi:single-strand selective monofunctional uracil DNA glycosylase